MKERFFSWVLVLLCILSFPLAAQEGFGFGDIADDGSAGFGGLGGGSPLAVSVSGEVGMELLGYVREFDEPLDTALDGNLQGRLNFEAQGANVKGAINLNVNPPDETFTFGSVTLDEAYLQTWFGDFEIEGGLRKLTWGKADSMGPLDVINPYDYRSFTNIADSMEIKLAQPMIHASYHAGSFSKIEAVLLPWFSPHRFAESGRWAQSSTSPLPVTRPSNDELNTLKYAQAGARFTTTIGPADIGAQYFYGRMYQPAAAITFTGAIPAGIALDYNRYHQIGLDYAQVIAGFNVRAEAATNLTGDLDGDDGAVYNPTIAWSLGFDRDLFWGINLNLQCNESIHLMNDEVSDDPLLDIEAGSELTSTRISAILSKKFLRDELEVRATGICGIETKDFLIVPGGIYWTIQDVQLELAAGIFGGDKNGQLGQYHGNSFVKVGLVYTF
ncbi:conserved hypothetical protein [Treponema primitia ZAS-2]|uniref:Uncharacterized protein n=1 Tax=Treponema primitia (strain ATCC BAA-887 / DSM 12427 / ZAS-2) TaxID=545694 RepID=F5YPW2_TREPZ|nr:hypothetical protein [Treponema primitia]AEF84020.1 conserved hypothetical protein [Treponema primitia ZAS-2]